MFWSSSWDDLHTFHVKFKEDIFIRKFINCVFDQKISSKEVFFKNLQIKSELYYKYNINIVSTFSKNSFSDYLFKLARSPYYLSSIRIIRYQQWLIVYFYILSPFSKKNLSSFSENKFSNVFKHSFKSYLHTTHKLCGFYNF